jgi:osmotically-inducible protein OsmY
MVETATAIASARGHTPKEADRSDAQIAAAVRRALEWDEFVREEEVRSNVTAGCVHLEGEVSTPAERDYVERVVRLLSGVNEVRNLLRVTRY